MHRAVLLVFFNEETQQNQEIYPEKCKQESTFASNIYALFVTAIFDQLAAIFCHMG